MRRPKRPCGKVGCPTLVKPPERYCAAHRREDEEHQREREREYDRHRGSAHQRGYGATWRKKRRAYLQRNPLCVECLRQGRVKPATDVDHIISRRRGGTDDESNLQALCHSCHSRKTNREDGGGWRNR